MMKQRLLIVGLAAAMATPMMTTANPVEDALAEAGAGVPDNGFVDNGTSSLAITATGDVIAVDDACTIVSQALEFNFDSSDDGNSAPADLTVECGADAGDRALYLSTSDVADPQNEGTDNVAGTIGGEAAEFIVQYEASVGTYSSIANAEVATVNADSQANVPLRSTYDRETYKQGGTVEFEDGSALYVYFE